MARPSLSAAVKSELKRRRWHGNVHELRNVIEHAVIVARGGQIELDQLPVPTPPASSVRQTTDVSPVAALSQLIEQWTATRLHEDRGLENLYERFLSVVEPPLLSTTITQEHRQCASAARRLGLHRHTLRKKLDHYALE